MAELTVKQLKEKHGSLVKEMRELNNKAKDEKRSFSSDDDAKWSKMNADLDALERDIKLAEIEERQAAEEAQDIEQRQEEGPKTIEYSEAFKLFFRRGMSGLTEEERMAFAGKGAELSEAEQRALSTAENTSGGLGYHIPVVLYREIEKYSLLYGGVEEVAKIISTDKGGKFTYTTSNNTSQTGEWIAENTQHNNLDPTINQVIFDDYTLSSKIVLASLQSINDAAFNVDEFIAEEFGHRMGRSKNAAFTNGDGSGKPSGFLPNISSGATAASSSVLAYDDFVKLLHSVDPTYRKNGRFMFNDSTFQALKLIKDLDGRPIFMPGLAASGMAADAPGSILGYPYTINQDMPDIGSAETPIAYGDFQKYVIRKVNQMGMLRLTERYADYLQVGFLAFQRMDGKLINTAAIKKLTMA